MPNPTCDGCENCGGAPMELNGLQFVCSNGQDTLLEHSDLHPVYDAAPAMLAMLERLYDARGHAGDELFRDLERMVCALRG
jgi:hypothetical protein